MPLDTADCAAVRGVSAFRYNADTTRGRYAHARVAAYHGCFDLVNDNGYFDADVLAGFDATIRDGVFVSVGSDAYVTVGSLHTVKCYNQDGNKNLSRTARAPSRTTSRSRTRRGRRSTRWWRCTASRSSPPSTAAHSRGTGTRFTCIQLREFYSDCRTTGDVISLVLLVFVILYLMIRSTAS
jgi:hypothetical protein